MDGLRWTLTPILFILRSVFVFLPNSMMLLMANDAYQFDVMLLMTNDVYQSDVTLLLFNDVYQSDKMPFVYLR